MDEIVKTTQNYDDLKLDLCMVCLSICMVYFMIKHRNKTVLACKET